MTLWSSDLLWHGPTPPIRQLRHSLCVWRLGLLVLVLPPIVDGLLAVGSHLRQLGLLPFPPPLLENPLKEHTGRLVRPPRLLRQLGLRRHQPSSARSLQDCSAVSFEIGLGPL